MKYFVLIGFLFSLSVSFSQLDLKYFGEYVSNDFTESFTIYSMDEMDEHCFFVDYVQFDENDELVKNLSGYGHCDDSEGMKAFFYFDEYKEPIVALLTANEFGEIEMELQFPDRVGVSNFFLVSGEDVEMYGDELEDAPSEVIFIRDDEAQLILFDDNNQIGFRIIGAKSSDCLENDYVGVLLPIDEEMQILEYSDGKGCKMKMQLAEVGVTVTESNCSKLHEKSCSSWNGLYKFP
jgi:hypothetical protein